MAGGAGGGLGDALLVALGAVPGAWLRFVLVNRLEPVLPHRHWGTLVVNLTACFGLGLLTALRAHGQASATFMLLIGTGFLGSLSTFSTLAAELEACLRQGNRREGLRLAAGSVFGGLLALASGLALG
jgi:CrcB protein